MKNTFDITKIPQEQLVAFYGLPFGAAASDGSVDKEELLVIFENLDLEPLNEKNKKKVYNFIVNPPDYDECLKTIAKGSEELKYAVVVGVAETIFVDDVIEPEEEEFLDKVCYQLDVTKSQKEAILNFVKEGRRIQREGLDNNAAEKAMKSAASGLTAVGVPIVAVYFSGTVIGLSAAGVTSGLAALGLGLGMVPGIGIAVLVGTGIFLGVRALLGDSKATKEKKVKEIRERKLQLVIKNLQEAVNQIIDRIKELEVQAQTAEANQEAINTLKNRLTALQRALKAKKQFV